MSLTSNFDFCVELGIATVREIFHLAFKSEDRYPHNVGPFTRTLSGREVTVEARVLDDETDPADLEFQDENHMLFSFPFELTVTTPEAPDPDLSRVTMRVVTRVPALLTTWVENTGEVLGMSFEDITAGSVEVPVIEGLPTIDVSNFEAAIHSKYDLIPHTNTVGNNTLTLYDDNRDATLVPPNAATPSDITADLIDHDGQEFLKVTAPLYVDVDLLGLGTYLSFGRMIFHRPITRTGEVIRVDMTAEPTGAGTEPIQSVVELDNAHPARATVIAQLTPLAIDAVNGFGIIEEPGFDEASARTLLQEEIASYLQPRRYPMYSPDSGDAAEPLSEPTGLLLVDAGVLAILMNRRSPGDPALPDNFLGGLELALSVGRAKVDEIIQVAIDEEFPDLDSDEGHHIVTDEGSANLKELSVVPSDPGTHGEGEGHLWVEGFAEVEIDCWPDPDVSFEGPIFVVATRTDTPDGCELEIEATPGDFDIDQSCCDVFVDLIIPIVGWIMLAVVESSIDAVGGELIGVIVESQEAQIAPIPPVINGIAEVTACLTDLKIRSDGFILPGEIEVRRLGESFEDREGDGGLPRP
ncbi:MAG: hypothetical protein BMS9Abin29_1310 [Gemmatimonadota bacterium]|nr:MAG: hypothetical protein BMS9Abin29_1310 [Gemmatimonadota bacterium]